MHLQSLLSNIRGNPLSEYLSIWLPAQTIFSRSSTNQESGEVFVPFVKCWTLKFRFYLSLSSTVSTQDIRRKRLVVDLPTDTYGEALSKQNSPSEISRDISSKNPKELQESDGGNPMGSAVKKWPWRHMWAEAL